MIRKCTPLMMCLYWIDYQYCNGTFGRRFIRDGRTRRNENCCRNTEKRYPPHESGRYRWQIDYAV